MMYNQSPANSLLQIAMQAAIPLHILRFREKGGPTPEDFKHTKEVADLLGEHGDLLLYGGKPRHCNGIQITTADLFNKVANAIAVLSHCPGGVTMFGSHWDAKTFMIHRKKQRPHLKKRRMKR